MSPRSRPRAPQNKAASKRYRVEASVTQAPSGTSHAVYLLPAQQRAAAGHPAQRWRIKASKQDGRGLPGARWGRLRCGDGVGGGQGCHLCCMVERGGRCGTYLPCGRPARTGSQHRGLHICASIRPCCSGSQSCQQLWCSSSGVLQHRHDSCCLPTAIQPLHLHVTARTHSVAPPSVPTLSCSCVHLQPPALQRV